MVVLRWNACLAFAASAALLNLGIGDQSLSSGKLPPAH